MLKKLIYPEIDQINASRTKLDKEALNVVKNIISDVMNDKDEAVIKYTKMYDNVQMNQYRVSKIEIEKAFQNIDTQLIQDLKIAAKNIRQFHQKQLPSEYRYNTGNDSVVGQLIRPIERIGIYVPGGTAAYPSTVLMNAIPAKVASVKEIVMISPPNKQGSIDDVILAAAKIAGVTEIYKVGGAQGIAALAYGTETIEPVSKIVGPGNIYVALAKKEVYGQVGIDMIAGPSEILIYADDQSNPTFVAADLLSQAEHDKLARVILVTESQALVEKTNKEITRQLQNLSRKDIAKEAMENNGFALIVKNQNEAIDAINRVAPEHLELLIQNPDDVVPFIMNAGAIFVGPYSPEPLGDYIAGPNHTLPTSGSARFSSPLSTEDFLKRTSYIRFSKNGLSQYQESIQRMAKIEGLNAHANAIKVRF